MTAPLDTNRAVAALCRTLTAAHTLPQDSAAHTAAHQAAWRDYWAATGRTDPTDTGRATRAGER